MKSYLYLLQIFGGGNPLIHNVIEYYGSAENAVREIARGDLDALPPNRRHNAASASIERSERIIEQCDKNGIDIILREDERYPDSLRNIYNPPTVLFVQGSLDALGKRAAVAIVGPRTPDMYAARLASSICAGLAQCGIVLISGLARGIDQTAHLSSVRAGEPTVAVLACANDVEYPANTARLRRDIIKGGGAVISELLPGTGCHAEYFKYRNRIISGLAAGTLVIGANDNSGSLITAKHAAEQDRDLFFTVPPDTLDRRYSRIIRYLRDGAVPVYDHYDVISEYYDIYRDRLKTDSIDPDRLGYLVRRGLVEREESAPVKIETVPPVIERTAADTTFDNKDDIPLPQVGGVDDYVKLMPKKYRILFGYEKPDEADEADEDDEDNNTDETDNTTAEDEEQPVDFSEPEESDEQEESDDPESAVQSDDLAGRLYGLIAGARDGISLDEILRKTGEDFGEVTELLADMEIDGRIECQAGNIFVAV